MDEFEALDQLTDLERGTDLSSFAMLLLEPDANPYSHCCVQQQQQQHKQQLKAKQLQQQQQGCPNHYYPSSKSPVSQYSTTHNRPYSLSIDGNFQNPYTYHTPPHPFLGTTTPTLPNHHHHLLPQQPPPAPTAAPSSPSSNTSNFRNFFRKRHKSVGSGSPGYPYYSGGQVAFHDSNAHSPTALPVGPPIVNAGNNGGNSSNSGGGSKIRNLFFGSSSKGKPKSGENQTIAFGSVGVSHEDSRRSNSLKLQNTSTLPDGPKHVANNTARHSISNTTSDYIGGSVPLGSSIPRVLYGNIYHTTLQHVGSVGCGGGVGVGGNGAEVAWNIANPGSNRTRHMSIKSQRKSSTLGARDQIVGPYEFVEMFRSRAYSDNHMSDQTRVTAKVKTRQRRISGTFSTNNSTTPDYCPFEARQVIIWMDSINGTQVFRLPSCEDEGKMIREFMDDDDDTVDMAYVKFLKAHPCYDVMPTSTKLVVLDTMLTVKKAFHALNDNRIHAAPLWDTKKQDFIGLLTISDFIHVLLRCYRDKMSILETSEDHSLSYWAEALADPQQQQQQQTTTTTTTTPITTMLFSDPKDSMYDVVTSLLTNRIHRTPIIDLEAGNVLYMLTLKRILRYLYLFFSHYNLPHPSFMKQTLADVNIGTYQDLAMITTATKLIDALEMMMKRRVSSLPIVDEGLKLVGIFNKSLLMCLESEEAYADLDIPIGLIFNEKTLESTKTCMRCESLDTIVERMVKTEVHRLVVVDMLGRVEGMLSCSDVMRCIIMHKDVDNNDNSTVMQASSGSSLTSNESISDLNF